MGKKIFKFATEILSWMVVGVILVGALFLSPLSQTLFHSKPTIALSGSMEPTIHTGSVFWVDTQEREPKIGDIVEYQKESGKANTITHRVISKNTGEKIRYTFKGDANEDKDPDYVIPDQIVGTVKSPFEMIGLRYGPISIPYLGYVMSYVRIWAPILVGISVAYLIVQSFLNKKNNKDETDK